MRQVETIEANKPAPWRRLLNFPLVAMLIGITVVLGGIFVSATIAKYAPDIPGVSPQVKFDLIAAPILILLYKLIIRKLGEHPRDDLRLAGAVKPLLIGLGIGFVAFTLVTAIAGAFGVYRIVGEGDFSQFLPALLLSAIFPAISEEMLFRGVLFRWIEEFGGSWAALLVTAAIFGAAHLANPNASMIAAVGIAFEAGILLGAAYMLTRNLWLAMGIHAAWNFTQGEIYDLPVSGTDVHGILVARLSGPQLLSGGSFGLEASVIAMVVATSFGLWLLFLAIRKGELVKPWWVRPRLTSR
jgi:hypothetical protein